MAISLGLGLRPSQRPHVSASPHLPVSPSPPLPPSPSPPLPLPPSPHLPLPASVPPCHLLRRTAGGKQDLLMQVGRWIARDADVVHGFNANTCGLQTIANRLSRKTRTVLDAIEPFF